MRNNESTRYVRSRLLWAEILPSGDVAFWNWILPILAWHAAYAHRLRRYVRSWTYASHTAPARHSHVQRPGPRHLRRTPLFQQIGFVPTPELQRLKDFARSEAAEMKLRAEAFSEAVQFHLDANTSETVTLVS